MKSKLQALCDSIRPDVLVRIACRELEAWYWGDLLAVEQAFGITTLHALTRKSSYRVPDSIITPKRELQKRLPRYEQKLGAELIAQCADIERNTSRSFQVFIRGLQRYSSAQNAGNPTRSP
uniref:Cytoplasmic protein n=1 Tax=uncultured bacterium contig00006 TaxID=1181498 RepID=A0A806KG69_9BACT|nr:hypothetical protein [uncultured bacterium contig00006]